MKDQKTMKERCAEVGGLLSCSYRTEDGRSRANVLVRAHDAKEARGKLRAMLGVAFSMFCVNWYVG